VSADTQLRGSELRVILGLAPSGENTVSAISKATTLVRALAATAFMALASSGAAYAASIPGLFNTGVDSSGVALGDNVADPHYSIILPSAMPAVTITTPNGAWTPHNLASDPGADYRWLWETTTGTPGNTTRTFRTVFDLSGLDSSSASISGLWATDNSGLILLNSVATAQTCGGFGSFCAFSLSAGFVAGSNTLDFQVSDFGPPAGFLVGSISGTASPLAAIPEPSTYALMIAGLGFVGFVAARRRKTHPAA
jgi:hypothetical protein